MMTCIHQPQFLPYLGFFDKVAQCGVYVILDDVEAIRNDFTNRNGIKGPKGAVWITIPVKEKDGVIIRDIEISTHINWIDKHLKTIQHFYGKTPYFRSYFQDIEKIYKKREWGRIIDIDVEFLKWVFNELNVDIDIIFSSKLNIKSKKTLRLVDICREIGANVYLSGVGGKNYMDLDLFAESGINVKFQNFKHPVYPQRFGNFIENLSIVDLLFNCGEKSLEILRGESK